MDQERLQRSFNPRSTDGASARGLLHVAAVGARARRAVEFGAVQERVATGIEVGRLALPRLERGRLEGTPVGEAELPRQAAELVHGVEVRGGELVGLATR